MTSVPAEPKPKTPRVKKLPLEFDTANILPTGALNVGLTLNQAKPVSVSTQAPLLFLGYHVRDMENLVRVSVRSSPKGHTYIIDLAHEMTFDSIPSVRSWTADYINQKDVEAILSLLQKYEEDETEGKALIITDVLRFIHLFGDEEQRKVLELISEENVLLFSHGSRIQEFPADDPSTQQVYKISQIVFVGNLLFTNYRDILGLELAEKVESGKKEESHITSFKEGKYKATHFLAYHFADKSFAKSMS